MSGAATGAHHQLSAWPETVRGPNYPSASSSRSSCTGRRLAAGMQAVLVRRGPWGLILSDPGTEERCLAVLPDLTRMPAVVAEHNARAQATRR